jgi:hypothetical protein
VQPNRGTRAVLTAVLVAFAASASYFLFFFFRDNFATHYPVKAVSAAILRAGSFPWWNFQVGGGQPLAGNPNTLTFYPDTLLYLVLPAHVAFNLHFLIHLAAAFFAFHALASRLGVTPRSAVIGAWFYVSGSIAMSLLSFYNMIPALALIPAALLALEGLLERAGAGDALMLGACCGLLALAGEPVTIAGAALLLLFAAAGRVDAKRAALIAAAAVVALVIASPLLVAYREVAGEVERGFRAFSAQTVLAASLRPHRLLELVNGPFLGLITDPPPHRYRTDPGQWPLFLPAIVIGPLLLPALLRRSDKRVDRLKIAGALLLLIALGRYNPAVAAIVEQSESVRIFRYPEKLVVPFGMVGALAIASWLDRAVSRRGLVISAAVNVIATVAAAFTLHGAAEGSMFRLIAGAAVTLATLGCAAAGKRKAAVILHALLLGWWGLRTIPVDLAAPYVQPPALAGTVESRVFMARRSAAESGAREWYRAAAQRLEPVWGAAHGVSYALDRSPEGMYSFLTRIASERAQSAANRENYLRIAGVSTVLDPEAKRSPNPVAAVQGVARTVPVRSVQEAVRMIESPEFDPGSTALVPGTGETVPQGRAAVSDVRIHPQSITFTSQASGPALVIVNQSYFSGWKAVADGTSLRILPANLDRLGVIVPAGQRVVTVTFGRRRTAVAVCAFASGALLLSAVAALIRSRNAMASPAR